MYHYGTYFIMRGMNKNKYIYIYNAINTEGMELEAVSMGSQGKHFLQGTCVK